MASMIEARKDHACLYVELENTDGILVTGGLDKNGQVLHTAEFYDIKEKKWTQISSMKIGRTEHTMALIYGIPTVIGGLYHFKITQELIAKRLRDPKNLVTHLISLQSKQMNSW